MFQGKAVVSKEEMERQFYAYDPAIKLANRVDLMIRWLLKKIADFTHEERNAKWVEDQIELLDSSDYHRAYQMLRRKKKASQDSFDDFDTEKEVLSRYVVSQRLEPCVVGLNGVDLWTLRACTARYLQIASLWRASMEIILYQRCGMISVSKHWNPLE